MFYMHPYLQILKLMRFPIDADQRGSTTFRCSKNWGKPDAERCVEGFFEKCEDPWSF